MPVSMERWGAGVWAAVGIRFGLLAMAVGSTSWGTWTPQNPGIDTNLRGVSAAYSLDSAGTRSPVLWASGSNGVILRSMSMVHGTNWTQLTVTGGEALDFRGIRAFDARTAYVMSIGGGGLSRIYKTTDGGVNWKLQYQDNRPGFFLDALACASEKDCFALSDPVEGKFLLLRNVDGEHWTELPRDKMPAALANEGAFAASGTSIALCGSDDIYIGTGGPAARVFHSADRGRTWIVAETPILSGEASFGIFSVTCTGSAVIVVGGDYKNVNRSDRVAAYSLDAGKTWKLATQQPNGFRSGLALVAGRLLVAVGPNGEDVSVDLGVTWTHSGSLNLNAITALDNQTVWAVGAGSATARFDPLLSALRRTSHRR
jgi:photosystem II stability/assembly factor-like uncharacterized protein